MKMTFPQYILNPTGDRTMPNTRIYEAMYKEKLDKLIVRENGKVNFYLFKDSPERFIAYIKVPSESCKGFWYDVVIEFRSKDKKAIASESLKDYYVRFYSNDPAFMYNFCYSFIKNDIFFMDLETKMPKIVRETKPNVTNPKLRSGYVKSLYFAYLIMNWKNLFDKKVWDYTARNYSKQMLLQMVDHASQKLANRQQAEKDNREDQKRFEKLQAIRNPNDVKNAMASSPAKHIMSSRSAKKARLVNRVKRI